MGENDTPASVDEGHQHEEKDSLVRHEEEFEVRPQATVLGVVRLRKDVETHEVDEVVSRRIEELGEVERVSANDEDSGEIETLPDGSISIPIFEEELVVTKRTVVRERVIVRKRTETKDERVTAELRKERLSVDADPGVDVEDDR